jgi:TruD family tRNA pseudouridine synthase
MSIVFGPDAFEKVGISYTPAVLGEGYIKLFERDFIVEEVTSTHTICSVDTPLTTAPKNQPFLQATLIKKGVSTLRALQHIAQTYNVSTKALGYAGLKDDHAITAQQITLQLPPGTTAQPLVTERVILTNFEPASLQRKIGDLWGNRFTILVRSHQVDTIRLEQRVQEVTQTGFPNFFSLQRFGMRLNNHAVGRAILQGRYEETLRLILVATAPTESSEVQQVRTQAAKLYGNWEEMLKLFQPLGEHYLETIKILSFLHADPTNFAGALERVPEMTRFCVSAYGSFCFNKVLSQYWAHGNLPESIPLLTNHPEIMAYYNQLLPEEEITTLSWQQPQLKNIAPPNITYVPTKVFPTVHRIQQVDQGQIYHFDLPKGAYATGFLSELYTLYQDTPVPAWVNQEKIETRLPFGYPAIHEVEEKFRQA